MHFANLRRPHKNRGYRDGMQLWFRKSANDII